MRVRVYYYEKYRVCALRRAIVFLTRVYRRSSGRRLLRFHRKFWPFFFHRSRFLVFFLSTLRKVKSSVCRTCDLCSAASGRLVSYEVKIARIRFSIGRCVISAIRVCLIKKCGDGSSINDVFPCTPPRRTLPKASVSLVENIYYFLLLRSYKLYIVRSSR